jgi:transposase InsO family protein
VKQALLDALQRIGSSPEIIHSDQGSEYRSKEYQNFLKANEIKVSMSKKSGVDIHLVVFNQITVK